MQDMRPRAATRKPFEFKESQDRVALEEDVEVVVDDGRPELRSVHLHLMLTMMIFRPLIRSHCKVICPSAAVYYPPPRPRE
jgi:hypothetical protein